MVMKYCGSEQNDGNSLLTVWCVIIVALVCSIYSIRQKYCNRLASSLQMYTLAIGLNRAELHGLVLVGR